jgi:citrate synthase
LAGVVAARTAIAHVDGRAGLALVRGYRLPELAARFAYEPAAELVLRGDLPEHGASAWNDPFVRGALPLASEDVELARALGRRLPAAEALVAALPICDDDAARAQGDVVLRALRVLARVPAVAAAVHGLPEPEPDLPYAARALRALGATRRDAGAVDALQVLLVLEIEHGLSASAFAARVAASSGAGAGVALAAACATLSGPRHGGATAEAADLLRRAAASGDAAVYVAALLDARARLPGFGHRIYRVPDPRVPPLRAAALAAGGIPLLPVADALVAAVEPRLGPKGVHANVDLYGAALADGLGIPDERFVAVFALGVAAGWLAHWIEQRATGRLVRPESAYDGPPERELPPMPA